MRGWRASRGRVGRRRAGSHWAGHRWAGRLVAAGVAGGLVVLAGCGVPIQNGPQAISVSPHLLSGPPQTTTTTTEPLYADAVTVFFTRTGKVAPVQREVPAPVTLQGILQLLVAGPTTLEATNGYQSAFNRTVRVLGADAVATRATVDFNRAFGLISGVQEVLAVAQVVLTITTDEPAITEVAFQIEGQPAEVPSATGALEPSPVTRAQYAGLVAPATAATAAPS